MAIDYFIATSILKRSIQVGKTTIPVVFIPVFMGCMTIALILNMVYLKRYTEVMTHLKKYHPDLYERVRRKPEIGPFYSKTYNASKPLIELAKQSKTLNNSTTERLLTNFVQFDRAFTWISSITIIGMILIFLIVGIIVSQSR